MTSREDPPNGPVDPEAEQAETSGDARSETKADDEKEWWEDVKGLPWGQRRPTRADLGCLFAIMGLGLYGLAMLPLRPLLLTAPPFVQALVTGSSIAMVRVGAENVPQGGWLWIVTMLIATLSIVKFDWIYWWAGRLWGQGLIDYLMGQRSERAKRNAARAEKLTNKYSSLALFLTYVPLLPIPGPIVYGVLGIAGTSLRKFLITDLIFALLTRAVYVYLGWRIGEPVVVVLQKIGDYSWYLSIALLIGVFATYFWRSRKKVDETADKE
ncbi:DedA family protein [Propionibacteriaceae bacterium Y1700]|uniref:DedA family protein n=1 Tax=Microlunatus sp. Y1700 TaxID=3418487 RepID=UPI003DA73C21